MAGARLGDAYWNKKAIEAEGIKAAHQSSSVKDMATLVGEVGVGLIPGVTSYRDASRSVAEFNQGHYMAAAGALGSAAVFGVLDAATTASLIIPGVGEGAEASLAAIKAAKTAAEIGSAAEKISATSKVAEGAVGATEVATDVAKAATKTTIVDDVKTTEAALAKSPQRIALEKQQAEEQAKQTLAKAQEKAVEPKVEEPKFSQQQQAQQQQSQHNGPNNTPPNDPVLIRQNLKEEMGKKYTSLTEEQKEHLLDMQETQGITPKDIADARGAMIKENARSGAPQINAAQAQNGTTVNPAPQPIVSPAASLPNIEPKVLSGEILPRTQGELEVFVKYHGVAAERAASMQQSLDVRLAEEAKIAKTNLGPLPNKVEPSWYYKYIFRGEKETAAVERSVERERAKGLALDKIGKPDNTIVTSLTPAERAKFNEHYEAGLKVAERAQASSQAPNFLNSLGRVGGMISAPWQKLGIIPRVVLIASTPFTIPLLESVWHYRNPFRAWQETISPVPNLLDTLSSKPSPKPATTIAPPITKEGVPVEGSKEWEQIERVKRALSHKQSSLETDLEKPLRTESSLIKPPVGVARTVLSAVGQVDEDLGSKKEPANVKPIKPSVRPPDYGIA